MNLATAHGSNHEGILRSCPLRQLALAGGVLDVDVGVAGARVEQVGHLPLGQPAGVLSDQHLGTSRSRAVPPGILTAIWRNSGKIGLAVLTR